MIRVITDQELQQSKFRGGGTANPLTVSQSYIYAGGPALAYRLPLA